jgi:hypothetical protein
VRLLYTLAIATAGCHLVFSVDAPPPPDGSVADGSVGDAITPDAETCATVELEEDFDDSAAPPCGAAMAQPSTEVGLKRVGGTLEMHPADGLPNTVSCTTVSYAFDVAGIEVVRVSGIATITELAVGSGGNVISLQVRHDATTTLLRMIENGTTIQSAAYQPEFMRFLRLARVNELVVGQVSGDGIVYVDFGTGTAPAPAVVNASIKTSTIANTQTQMTAVVDNLITCRR